MEIDGQTGAEIAASRCFVAGFRNDEETASSLWRAACRYWTSENSTGAELEAQALVVMPTRQSR
jgi:hypothetical protein